ncbi:MAG: AI-2E family transporter [Chloroflexi bacterium]|nr:MAG: AI-2E family transporter [Chloroflexota bacterium]
MAFSLTERQRRWLDALLILATLAAAFVVIGFVQDLFFSFGDIVLVFFLAWLLAFILSPIVSALVRMVPRLPRVAAVVVVYAALLGALVFLTVLVANAIGSSISDFIRNVPQLRDQIPAILAPWQDRLRAIGLGQVDLFAQANAFLDNVASYANELVGPLQQLAVASLGVLGNLLLVLILSLYMVADRDREEARLLETTVARSFGGFLRGQAVMGAVYGLVAAVVSGIFGLDYLPATSALSGVLMAIPFFGPFVSWAPPVLVAMLLKPEVLLPTLIAMAIGWIIVMNVLQPRLMEQAVGIHPIVVIASVLIGSKIGGIAGAIFGIPIAAVVSAFFFHILGQVRATGPITRRAAERLAAREGREVRIPREPSPGIDPDVEDLASPGGPSTASTAGPSTASTAGPGAVSTAGPGAVSTSTPSPGTAIGTAGPDLGSSA